MTLHRPIMVDILIIQFILDCHLQYFNFSTMNMQYDVHKQ